MSYRLECKDSYAGMGVYWPNLSSNQRYLSISISDKRNRGGVMSDDDDNQGHLPRLKSSFSFSKA